MLLACDGGGVRTRRRDQEAAVLAMAARGRERGLAVAALESEGGCWSHRSHAIENPRLEREIVCLDVSSVYVIGGGDCVIGGVLRATGKASGMRSRASAGGSQVSSFLFRKTRVEERGMWGRSRQDDGPTVKCRTRTVSTL